jgi:Secretion system C-terminal sorting domain
VYSLPAIPTITKKDSTLTCDQASAAYQWYKNDTTIVGATNRTYLVSQNGTYKVKVTNANGCSRLSDTIRLMLNPPVGLDEADMNAYLNIFPNPVSSTLFIQAPNQDEPLFIDLFGRQIQVVFTKTTEGYRADLTTLTTGVYFLKFHLNGKDWYKKISVIK